MQKGQLSLQNARTIGAVLAAALIFAQEPKSSSSARFPSPNEEVLCTKGPEGEEKCEAIYFEPEMDASYHADEGEGEDFSGLAINECLDHSENCAAWAEKGECDSNPGYMKYHCAVSCQTCPAFDAAYEAVREGNSEGPCTDNDHQCATWAAMGECEFNPGFMLYECERSCFLCYEDTNQFGVHQITPPDTEAAFDKTFDVIEMSTSYMKRVWSDPKFARVRHKCKNMDKLCSFWAAIGECEGNSSYMKTNCAPACQTCELLDVQLRCPTLPGNDPVWKPGDLNSLFENMVDNADESGEYLKYKPQALSRPKIKRDGTTVPGVDVDGPWVITLENFISDEEADALIAAGHSVGYKRSSDVGLELPDGTRSADVNDGRTSHNAWCDDTSCLDDPIIGPVIERIANVTKTNVHNSEYLQLLRYEPGQYYQRHHDYIEYQQDLPCGVRMLTLFLYLNDVEEGGGTAFPDLDLVIKPQKGNAVLWPSVLNDAPEEKDFRTDHEAHPVIKGVKYGANAWIHSRNYRESSLTKCT